MATTMYRDIFRQEIGSSVGRGSDYYWIMYQVTEHLVSFAESPTVDTMFQIDFQYLDIPTVVHDPFTTVLYEYVDEPTQENQNKIERLFETICFGVARKYSAAVVHRNSALIVQKHMVIAPRNSADDYQYIFKTILDLGNEIQKLGVVQESDRYSEIEERRRYIEAKTTKLIRLRFGRTATQYLNKLNRLAFTYLNEPTVQNLKKVDECFEDACFAVRTDQRCTLQTVVDPREERRGAGLLSKIQVYR